MHNIRIDPEFKSYIRKLKLEEKQLLTESILSEGCRDPLVIWRGKNILLDGHNRYEICTLNNVNYKVEYLDFDNRRQAFKWMLHNQLGRRNVTPIEAKYIRGQLYSETKQEHGGDRKSRGNNFPLKSTAEQVGEQTGVTDRTVKNDEKFSKSVNKIAETFGNEARAEILGGEISATAKDIEELAKVIDESPDKAKKIYHKAKVGDAKNLKEAKKEIEKQEQINERTKQALEVVEKPKNYIHGDCLDVLQTLQPKSVKLLLTDPPYGTDFQSNRRTATAQLDKIANDVSPETAAKLLADMLNVISPSMQDDCRVLIFTSQAHYPLFRGVVEGAGYKVGRVLTWVKENHTSGDLSDFSPQTEWIINAWRGNHGISPRASEVLDYSREHHTSHPTEKPTALLSRLIEVCTIEGELVVDPFAGTGATIESALKLNRKALGIELSQNWFNEGVIRLSKIEDKAA